MRRIWLIAWVAACTHAHDPGPSNEPDAGAPTVACGDSVCDVGETRESCPEDCARCGDLVCSPTESGETCPADCALCGDGVCNHGETLASCSADCSVCGDAMCTGPESITSCAADCSVCGDALCTGDESTSCPQDCAAAVKLQNNSTYTLYYFYVRTCTASTWGTDLLGASVVSPGASFTVSSVPQGCYYFRAESSGSTVYWQSQAVTLTAGQTYTWTIFN
jgi:hypothetical protein